jgi:DNA-binding transcriptional ArsR family regulator
MVKHSSQVLDAAFGALADPTRRAILEQLSRGRSSPTVLAEPFDLSLPAISRHLRVLERAGLISRRKQGRVHHCTIRPGPLDEAMAWLERHRVFWERQLQALAKYLDETQAREESSWRRSRSRPRTSSHGPTRGR